MRSTLLSLALLPNLAYAGLFTADSMVKMLDAKSFKQTMKTNQTSLVAFVAPWCGHCQQMAPEFNKAALGLHPLLPFYAVDCDDDKNKRLCAEQGVKGFPTVKVFPRGSSIPPMTYERPERSASAFYYFATRRVHKPKTSIKIYYPEDLVPWIEKRVDAMRTLLMTNDKKTPLLWEVLANKYAGQIEFGIHRDRQGKGYTAIGMEPAGKKESKVLVYPPGSTTPFIYEGLNKLDSLSKFYDGILDGSVDITVINEEAKKEEYDPTEEELDIERKQEAQRMALLHGGYAEMIDFEAALKKGDAASFHDTNGFGSAPLKKKVNEEAPKAEESKAAEPAQESEPATAAEAAEAESATEAVSATEEATVEGATETPAPEAHVGKDEAEL